MQAFFIILGALIVLILGLFIFSLVLSPTVKVERSLLIPGTAGTIFPYVNILKNWELWSPWKELDPNMRITYGEKDSGAGAGYSWESKNRNVGKGSMVITISREDQYIATETDFMNMGIAKGYFRFEPSMGGTLVTWGMVTNMGQHPVRKLMGLMMDKWVGNDFEKGLRNLSKLVAKQ
ncbi:polyketide cyclase/dehydrase/lipid transport protein [Chitinophaga dinghuensis]|uniref:Polyketide cyclase/dehydrase/lipid transport protein n=1 Tax=Chitinophaga dinghuensis TaxID=1539050 RepID=A0A327W0S2_9BACT|nr:SRPBCC family protein [Chitinophaga dinghuensis]RAJ81835.1 polyketide cyclase/dehydrase/lipid transport protein [Chitinophaga dinghuensis]